MDFSKLDASFGDQKWRLNNLYKIKTDEGNELTFKMKPAQEDFFDRLHYRNIILKARQIGFSTLIQIIMLDMAVFYPNTKCLVIAQTEKACEGLFREKIKFAYQNLPQAIRDHVYAVRENQTELYLSNGSSMETGITARSGTYQMLHISEYGKICATGEKKGDEILTGALPAVPSTGTIFIESTADGNSGHYYNMVQKAMARESDTRPHRPSEYKFFFYPWYDDPKYVEPPLEKIPDYHVRYFDDLRTKQSIKLTPEQKAWWIGQHAIHQEKIYKEYPAYPNEAFNVVKEGAIYARHLLQAQRDRRIKDVPYNPRLPVETWWDCGRDMTVVWFAQRDGPAIYLINYYERVDANLHEAVEDIQAIGTELGYRFSRHCFPHDIGKREWSSDRSNRAIVDSLGLSPIEVTPKVASHVAGHNATALIFPRCYFDQEKCEVGLQHLREYRRKFLKEAGIWSDKPEHNSDSHAADAFRTGAMAPEPRSLGPTPQRSTPRPVA